jgi:uncharacterized membrane protein
MKRTGNLLYIIIIISALVLLFCPHVQADSLQSFYVDEYKIKAEINKSGDIHIHDEITYSFDGIFNGVTREIDLKEADKLIIHEISSIDSRGVKTVYKKDNGSYESNSGNTGDYRIKQSDKKLEIKVFEPSVSELKKFIYEYTIYNTVTVYNDIAEFYWKMIGSGWDCSISNIEILIDIPEGAAKEDLRVWAHGPYEGLSEIIDGNTYRFTAPSLPPNTFLETRLAFPNNLVPESKNTVNKNGLQDIIDDETVLADKANRDREKARKTAENQVKLKSFLNIFSYLLFPLWIFLFIIFYIKYDKEYKPQFTGKYYRDIPSKITPAEVSHLMSFGKIKSRDVTATLLDLTRKGYLKLEAVSVIRKKLFSNKEIPTFRFTKIDTVSTKTLKDHEKN